MGDCCFYKRLLPKTLNKKQQAPKLPKHPPKRAGFDNFLDSHFGAFCKTVCKFAPQRGTKMTSIMIPLCDSMALLRPSRGPPWETPEGLGPSRGPCMRGYMHHVWLLRPEELRLRALGRSCKSPMGGRGEYTQAGEGGARGAPKAAEREGPLSPNIGVSYIVLQEPVVEGATGPFHALGRSLGGRREP